jgi:hypothetical protein
MTKKSLPYLALILLGLLVLAWAAYSIANPIISPQNLFVPSLQLSSEATSEISQPSSDRLNAIAQLVGYQIGGTSKPELEELALLDYPSEGVYIALRSGGIEEASAWTTQAALTGELISSGIQTALAELSATPLGEIDAVELCISSNHREISADSLPANVERGILGISANFQGRVIAFSPTEMLAKNLGFDNAIERMATTFGISQEELLSSGTFFVFDCEQIFVFLEGGPRAVPLFRGNQIVSIDAVTLENTAEFARLASDWLVQQVQDDGRMVYLYYPSRGEESTGNNMIRQWMATLALDRIAAFSDDESLVELTKKNILYNLDHFYVVEDGLGLIDFQGEVKLGAMALAALALHEHPDHSEFKSEIEALSAGIEKLWNEDGSFETFYRPEGRSGQNQNFYPGETLLFWSALYAENRDPDLLNRFMQSFTYYREWHRQNINPAFIPWHTQAYYNFWKLTGNEELKSFIFEMNDWLLDFQEIGSSPYDDLSGRFYDSSRPQYGPPHASSDGVYLEGLVDAYLLAKENGDSQRQDAYALAIRYGIRSLMQLQFADEIDMYYISKTDKVLGGLRTTEYDNSIRVDNVQHGLMAMLKILVNPEAYDIFEN